MPLMPGVANQNGRLHRELSLGGTILMGLGAILGTGVFVSIGMAAGIAGSAVIPAIVIAALLAMCNALSAAQLAAAHPVSGGTYEYGYQYLNHWLGFVAGWLFLCAKSASAATAALGLAGYLVYRLGLAASWHIPLALLAVVALTTIVLTGMRRSNWANILIVGTTLLTLAVLVIVSLPRALDDGYERLTDLSFNGQAVGLARLLQASALMFVAFNGYGRIATLGEEVYAPARTIPRAILTTLAISAAIYIAVAVVSVGTLGAGPLAAATHSDAAPLQRVVEALSIPGVAWLLAIGAMTAMLGVLLNLILGLSRVLLAMGRRRDMPKVLAHLDSAGMTPYIAVLVIGLIVLGLTAIGSVQTTWAFSAFTVLLYYAITNLAALRLPVESRKYPRIFAWAGLLGCLGLAFWVDIRVWLAGLLMLGAGLLWRFVALSLRHSGA